MVELYHDGVVYVQNQLKHLAESINLSLLKGSRRITKFNVESLEACLIDTKGTFTVTGTPWSHASYPDMRSFTVLCIIPHDCIFLYQHTIYVLYIMPTEFSPCVINTCLNNGTCMRNNLKDEVVCSCTSEYTGETCSKRE